MTHALLSYLNHWFLTHWRRSARQESQPATPACPPPAQPSYDRHYQAELDEERFDHRGFNQQYWGPHHWR